MKPTLPWQKPSSEDPDTSYKGLAKRGVEIGEESLELQRQTFVVLQAILEELRTRT